MTNERILDELHTIHELLISQNYQKKIAFFAKTMVWSRYDMHSWNDGGVPECCTQMTSRNVRGRD